MFKLQQNSYDKTIVDKIIIGILHIYILSIPFSSGLCRLLPTLAFALWFFSSYYLGIKELLKEFPIFKYILAFVLYMTISLFWSDSLYAGKKGIDDYLYWIVLIVFATVVNKDNYKFFLISFIIASFLSLFISYGLMFNIIKPINKFPIYWFLDSIDYSIYLSLSLLMIFYLIISIKYSFIVKLFLVLLFIVMINMLFNSDGRTGQYGFIIALLLMIISYFNFTFKIKVLFTTIFILFASLILIFNNSADNKFIRGISDIETGMHQNNFDTSLGIRYVTAKIAFDASLDKPIFGHGIGDDYAEYIEKIKTQYSQYKSFLLRDNQYIAYRPHCQYMFVLYRLGLVGLILFMLILYKMYSLKIEMTSYSIVYRSILIVLIFSMLFNNVLKSTLTTAMFLVFIGIAIGLSKKSLNKQL